MKLCRSGALCAPYNKNKAGISLITLIITIIVIIILAAIVIFTGLRTPDSAQFSSFAQQVDNVQMAVTNKFADLKTQHAIAKEYRTDEQIYIEIATASDPGQYAAMNTTTVKNENSTTVSSIEEGSEIQNIDATKSTNEEHSIGMELPKVRENNTAWYVTKEGRVFNANGFTYSGKTYFDAKTYCEGEIGSNDTKNSNRAEEIYASAISQGTVLALNVPLVGTSDVKPEAGLYDAETKELIMSWNKLLKDGTIINVNNGVLNKSSFNVGSKKVRLVIDDSVTQIQNLTGINQLQEVIIPKSVTVINGVAFAGTGLTHIEIPGTVLTFDNINFGGCSSLESISIEKGSISSSGFGRLF